MAKSNFIVFIILLFSIQYLVGCLGDPFSYRRPLTKNELAERKEEKKEQPDSENNQSPSQNYTNDQITRAFFKRELNDAVAMGSMWYVDPNDCENLQFTALAAFDLDNNTSVVVKSRNAIGLAGVVDLSFSTLALTGILDLELFSYKLPEYSNIVIHSSPTASTTSKYFQLTEQAITIGSILYSIQYSNGDLRQYVFPSLYYESNMAYLQETDTSYYNGLPTTQSLKFKGDIFARLHVSDSNSNVFDRTRDRTRYARVPDVVFDVNYELVSLDKALVLSTSERVVFESDFDIVVDQSTKIRIINIRKFTSRFSNFYFSNINPSNFVEIITNDLVTPADVSLAINGFILLAGEEANELGAAINVDLGFRDNGTVTDSLVLTIGAARCPFDSKAGCDQILNPKN